jgi:hypothetical protein
MALKMRYALFCKELENYLAPVAKKHLWHDGFLA